MANLNFTGLERSKAFLRFKVVMSDIEMAASCQCLTLNPRRSAQCHWSFLSFHQGDFITASQGQVGPFCWDDFLKEAWPHSMLQQHSMC